MMASLHCTLHVLNGHLDITKYLISDCNCNPQCSTNYGNTPLHCACQNGHLEIAKYLITEFKCNPEHGNVDGFTPLHSSASKGHLAVVKYLVSELGCNPHTISKIWLHSIALCMYEWTPSYYRIFPFRMQL